MRALILAVLATAPAAAAEPQPAPGRYCAPGLPDISISPGAGAGIDLMDCRSVKISGGRLRSPSCYGMGGAAVSYDTDLVILPGGELLHDGVRFRRRDRGPCP